MGMPSIPLRKVPRLARVYAVYYKVNDDICPAFRVLHLCKQRARQGTR